MHPVILLPTGVERSGLPNCNHFCPVTPQAPNPPTLNRNWDGIYWQGSTLEYTCHHVTNFIRIPIWYDFITLPPHEGAIF